MIGNKRLIDLLHENNMQIDIPKKIQFDIELFQNNIQHENPLIYHGFSYLGQIYVGEITGKLDGYGCILMEVRVFGGKSTGFDYFDNDYQLDGVLSIWIVEWVGFVGKFKDWWWSGKKKEQFDNELNNSLIFKVIMC